MNKIAGFGFCFQHSAKFLFDAAQTDLVPYPRPETAICASTNGALQVSRRTGRFRLLWGRAGEQKLCQISVRPCPGRQQWPGGPRCQSLSVTSPVESLQTERQPCVSLPRLRKEQDQRRESSLPKFLQVLVLVVYQVFQPLCEFLFFFYWKKKKY